MERMEIEERPDNRSPRNPPTDETKVERPIRSRRVEIGKTALGGGEPILVQSMAATRTQDEKATIRQVRLLHDAGAGIVRIAVDSDRDVLSLARIRDAVPEATLSVDLQENYRLAAKVAPLVDKIRYNPGHLHHHERSRSIEHKVRDLVEAAREYDCAIRIGVNCGSVDPALKGKFGDDDVQEVVTSAIEHSQILDSLGFSRYVVSIKDSDPIKVIEANRRFSRSRPDVPLHLGVTEAGMPPEGIVKTRVAFEQLISLGIGDTIRVSLTVPFDDKAEEIRVGRQILEDIQAGRFRSVPSDLGKGLNIISCPSCSRVENENFVELAQQVREITRYAKQHAVTIAVMGCRVNGPGETDDADLGLWCAPSFVNLKKKQETVGAFSYTEVLDRLRVELDAILASHGIG